MQQSTESKSKTINNQNQSTKTMPFSIPARDFNDDAEIVIVPKGQQGVAAKTEDSDEDFFKNTGFPFTPQSSFGFNIGFSDSFSGKSNVQLIKINRNLELYGVPLNKFYQFYVFSVICSKRTICPC